MSKMNKPLANYYHEARAQVKKLKTMQEENKKRAERRAEIIAPVAADPLQNLFITGTSCKLLRGAESHAMNEAGENLVPWNGQQDNMIDRFDVRALLDFYKEPDPRVLAARQKSNEELKLEQTLRFESYRDLVRLAARGFSEAQGLATVDSESLDRRAAQHAAMQAATDAVYFNPKPGAAGGPGTAAHGAAPAGTGMYSAMGFSYDSSTGGPAGAAAANPAAAAAVDASDSSSDDDSDYDSEDDDESALAASGAGGLAGPVSEAELAQEAEDERVDDMAEAYGLADFSYRLHRALKKEGEEEARMRNRPKKNMSRKKAANRAKRMAGMGLDPSTGLPLHQHNPYKDPRALINPWQDSRAAGNASPDRPHHRRSSPDYDAGGWRVRDRSPTPPRPGEKQYITEFVSSDAAGAAGDDFMGGSNAARPGIIEALPDRPDPAMLGGIQPVGRGVMTLQGIKREDLHMRLKMAADDDDVPTYRRRSPTPPRRRASSRSRSRSPGRRRRSSRSRSRSGSREHHRRGSDRERDRRGRHRSRSRSKSRSRSQDRYRRTSDRDRDRRSRRSSRSCSRSRSRSRDRRQRRSSDGGGSSRQPGSSSKAAGGSYSSGKGAAAAAGAGSRAGASVGGGGSAAATAAAAAGPKESAQERLKRLMQAQLNKAAQKDSLANAQKKIQAEKDKVARQQIERVARQRGCSPSPGARDRSRSPTRYRPARRSYSP